MSQNLFDGIGVESLEQRSMMAGNVTADLVNGDLVINGDAADNEVVVRATQQVNTFVVSGLNGTTINGGNDITVNGVTDDFRINLRDGNNVLMLTANGPDGIQPDLVVPDDLQIRSGNGNDLLVLDVARVLGNTTMNTGAGDDGLVTFSTRIDGNLAFNSGAGNDFLGLDTTSIGGRTRSNLGSGIDKVAIFTSSLESNANLVLGSGNDFVGFVASTFETDLSVVGGSDTDLLLSNATTVTGERRVRSVETDQSASGQQVSDNIADVVAISQFIDLIFDEGTGF